MAFVLNIIVFSQFYFSIPQTLFKSLQLIALWQMANWFFTASKFSPTNQGDYSPLENKWRQDFCWLYFLHWSTFLLIYLHSVLNACVLSVSDIWSLANKKLSIVYSLVACSWPNPAEAIKLKIEKPIFLSVLQGLTAYDWQRVTRSENKDITSSVLIKSTPLQSVTSDKGILSRWSTHI